jgi:hypothetical protein
MWYSKRGLNKRSTVVICCATVTAYMLSSAGFLAASIALGLKIVNGSLLHAFVTVQVNFNSIILFNRKHRSLYLGYIRVLNMKCPEVLFADGVVVWRMYVLCGCRPPRLPMLIPFTMLGITAGM